MYGNEIKKTREYNGSTQIEVAKATGMPQSTISWIELDKGIPNIQQCVLLANYYDCTLDELIGLSDTSAPERKNSALPAIPTSAVSFIKEYESLISDNNYITMSKLYKEISPELRALTLGYIVGVLQNNGVNTKKILGY